MSESYSETNKLDDEFLPKADKNNKSDSEPIILFSDNKSKTLFTGSDNNQQDSGEVYEESPYRFVIFI